VTTRVLMLVVWASAFGWQRIQVGPIAYIVQPGIQLGRQRAEAAVAFADSVAAFEVPKLDQVTYDIARSPEDLHRATGFDWTFGGLGQNA
jgi:hypothetical protein